nr:unnamed protein product [Digitaria exilis]
MATPTSTSIGVLGSLLRKLKGGIHYPLKGHLEEIHGYLNQLLWLEEPTLKQKSWMKEVRELSYDIDDYLDMNLNSTEKQVHDQFSTHLQEAIERYKWYNLHVYQLQRKYLPVSHQPTQYTEVTDLFRDLEDEVVKCVMSDEQELSKVVAIVGPGGIEDYTILKDDLLKLWVAEGFITAVSGQDNHMEEAGKYFDELVKRRMIQPVDVNANNEVLSCTLHSMVLDLIANKSVENNFIVVLDKYQGVPLLEFKEGTMPNLQKLHLGFNAYGAASGGHTPVGMMHLPKLQLVSAVIGCLQAEQSDRNAAESAMRDTISAHGKRPVVNIRWVDWNFYPVYGTMSTRSFHRLHKATRSHPGGANLTTLQE